MKWKLDTVYLYPDVPQKVWVRRTLRMPRIPETILDCSVYLYRDKQDAEEGKRSGASGFFLSVPGGWEEPLGVDSIDLRTTQTERPPELWVKGGPRLQWGKYRDLLGRDHVYLVSNRHVALKQPEGLFARINTATGRARPLKILRESWVLHPDLDDVAVCPIADLRESDRYTTVPHDLLVTPDIAKELLVGPGDDVFMVGRYVNHSGIQKNMPSVRFGHIAIMADEKEKITVDDGLAQVSYLVEANSYPGYSGSPVFLYTPPWELRDLFGRRSPRRSAAGRGNRLWLLGVNWGHYPAFFDAKTSDGADLTVTLNAGMMGVTPAWKLLELLNEKELQAQRAQEREQWEREGRATRD